ncbi:MAG: DUF1559 domain-containing protein, partial [Gemmataceae bacterium]
ARSSCTNNLRQLGLAAQNYSSKTNKLPPGIAHPFSNSGTPRYSSLFIELLPELENDSIVTQWNFTSPNTNAMSGAVIKTLVCPVSGISQNPISFGSQSIALSSYAGNGGSRSFPLALATFDGIFHAVGPNATTNPILAQKAILVEMDNIPDGTSNTIMFGERNIGDSAFDSWQKATITPAPTPPLTSFSSICAWSAPATNTNPQYSYAIGSVTISAYGGINQGVSQPYIPPAPPLPMTPTTWDSIKDMLWTRVCGFGSNHVGGCLVCTADGAVRFMRTETNQQVLNALCTRNGREAIGDW